MFSVQCIPRDIGNSWIWYRYVKQWNTNKSYKDDKVRQDRQGTSVSAVQCTLFTNQFVRMCSGQWSHVKSLHFYLLYLVELLLCTILTGKVDAVCSFLLSSDLYASKAFNLKFWRIWIQVSKIYNVTLSGEWKQVFRKWQKNGYWPFCGKYNLIMSKVA